MGSSPNMASVIKRLQMGAAAQAGGSGVGIATPVCAMTRHTPLAPASSAGRGPLLTSRQHRQAAAMEVPAGYDSSQAFENPVAQITELKLQIQDMELENLSRDHAQEKFEREIISQVQSLGGQVQSLEGQVAALQEALRAMEEAQQVVHDGQMEENRRMGERVGALELSVSNMQRMSSASARAAEERPVHMPGGEVPSTSGRDEQQAKVHKLPDELAGCMQWEMQRTNCTLKLDNIVKYDQGSDPAGSAEAAIREMNGPACKVTYARWASPRQPGVLPSRLIVTFLSPMMADMVLNMAQWLRPGQAIYPELGPVEAAVASVVRKEFGNWRRTAPPAARNCFRVDRAGVRDMAGNLMNFSAAAINAGMAALQKQRAREANRPVAEARA